MPTYRYRGDACEHEFEVRQSFADDPLTTCEQCGGPVHRVISAAPIVFKGTGWYITDSRPTHDATGGVQDAAKVKKSDDSTPASEPAAKASESPTKGSDTASKPTATTSA